MRRYMRSRRRRVKIIHLLDQERMRWRSYKRRMRSWRLRRRRYMRSRRRSVKITHRLE